MPLARLQHPPDSCGGGTSSAGCAAARTLRGNTKGKGRLQPSRDDLTWRAALIAELKRLLSGRAALRS